MKRTLEREISVSSDQRSHVVPSRRRTRLAGFRGWTDFEVDGRRSFGCEQKKKKKKNEETSGKKYERKGATDVPYSFDFASSARVNGRTLCICCFSRQDAIILLPA